MKPLKSKTLAKCYWTTDKLISSRIENNMMQYRVIILSYDDSLQKLFYDAISYNHLMINSLMKSLCNIV
ncbi:hypothetical protein KM620_gp122 [Hyposidra talaca nucleopolyhedrovirus]|uniref:Uncharacterized protein n=1 Tax=Hyposidra talaca nucleopolyhedrovirus TaxID=1070315 RepID=A0A2Z4HI99_9ABAC|nr:hypothetical protein KM620_gp122 [Hyposidra talaca nucleopolyhedrovirus]AWW14482.1 hypothetical protein HytaNPV_gp122 [Hyposidra talaca nucleopolyhedrovirus]